MSVAERIAPTSRQLEFQDWEFGLFLHFGLRTFYEGYVDFDNRTMLTEAFQPSALDCEQWILTAKKAGMKYAVLTAKHHDGFSNWPSKYSTFTVAQSPWKEGAGDVVKEFTDACRKHGLKAGLYYSPYDGAVDFFKGDAKAYDDYFVDQITELLTGYGEIDILWFDGCGSEGHQYDWPRIIGEIRRLQPNILIFNMGEPDFRWVGNEDGIAPLPCWNVTDSTSVSILTDKKESLGEHIFLPAECDVQMRNNWFYSDHDEHHIKSLDELMGLYYLSVGRGSNLLLNIGPNREGLLPAKDAERLLEFGAEVSRRLGNPVAALENPKLENGAFIYEASEKHMLDHIVIEEDLTFGESVQRFAISIVTGHSGTVVPIYEGRNMGHKAIIRLPAVKVRGIIVAIVESIGQPSIKRMSVHYAGEA